MTERERRATNKIKKYLPGFARRATRRSIDNLHRVSGKRIVYCLGDSHAKVFQYVDQNNYLPRTIFRCVIVGGATALGMVNPNSKTNALLTFQRKLGSISQRDHILFLLGEVDCGFVIWYRAAKYGLTVQAQMEESLRNYKRFIA
jgi:hypothetical protein